MLLIFFYLTRASRSSKLIALWTNRVVICKRSRLTFKMAFCQCRSSINCELSLRQPSFIIRQPTYVFNTVFVNTKVHWQQCVWKNKTQQQQQLNVKIIREKWAKAKKKENRERKKNMNRVAYKRRSCQRRFEHWLHHSTENDEELIIFYLTFFSFVTNLFSCDFNSEFFRIIFMNAANIKLHERITSEALQRD